MLAFPNGHHLFTALAVALPVVRFVDKLKRVCHTLTPCPSLLGESLPSRGYSVYGFYFGESGLFENEPTPQTARRPQREHSTGTHHTQRGTVKKPTEKSNL